MHGSFHRLGVKMAKMDNRKFLGFLLVLALGGSLLLGDWQSIGRDPCSVSKNITITDNYVFSGDALTSSENSVPNATVESFSATEGSVLAREICEEHSGGKCFWNPQSRVTGETCNTCFPVCLSRTKSLCFYQFTLGVLLVSFATPLLYVFTSVISSDIMPAGSQVS